MDFYLKRRWKKNDNWIVPIYNMIFGVAHWSAWDGSFMFNMQEEDSIVHAHGSITCLQTSMQEKDNIMHPDDKYNDFYVLICKRKGLFLA